MFFLYLLELVLVNPALVDKSLQDTIDSQIDPHHHLKANITN